MSMNPFAVKQIIDERNSALDLVRTVETLNAELQQEVEELRAALADAVAAEREACAQACDQTYYQFIGPGLGEVRYGVARCASAIRARSQEGTQ